MSELVLIVSLVINLLMLVALLLLINKKNFKPQLDQFRQDVSVNFERTERILKDEFFRNREEANINSKHAREELANFSKLQSDTVILQLSESSSLLKNEFSKFSEQLNRLTISNENKLEQLKEKIEEKLITLQQNNEKKLEEMRVIVDEKLHTTLEKRLGESFRLVSERLDMVHKGLGEMQALATGVGDLKKVLTNIKARGTWGEIQLGSLIEQILTPEQFAKNVATKKGSSCVVEYAVRMPGNGVNNEDILWLPIDAKFPLEDYQRLCDAQDRADTALVDEAIKALENRIKQEAKDISDKYLDPPNTTDFAILFLPVEGLYAEVLRHPGFYDRIQREYRVVLAGPTTLTAILNSLQMGFRTLAIEKRSSEVWNLLGMVKTEFSSFGGLLDKIKKKLQEASNTIENASTASRKIERKLRDVQALPSAELIQLPSIDETVDLSKINQD
ncbi:MAG: DNA recombination protein RmuC [Bacillota bacterium]